MTPHLFLYLTSRRSNPIHRIQLLSLRASLQTPHPPFFCLRGSCQALLEAVLPLSASAMKKVLTDVSQPVARLVRSFRLTHLHDHISVLKKVQLVGSSLVATWRGSNLLPSVRGTVECLFSQSCSCLCSGFWRKPVHVVLFLSLMRSCQKCVYLINKLFPRGLRQMLTRPITEVLLKDLRPAQSLWLPFLPRCHLDAAGCLIVPAPVAEVSCWACFHEVLILHKPWTGSCTMSLCLPLKGTCGPWAVSAAEDRQPSRICPSSSTILPVWTVSEPPTWTSCQMISRLPEPLLAFLGDLVQTMASDLEKLFLAANSPSACWRSWSEDVNRTTSSAKDETCPWGSQTRNPLLTDCTATNNFKPSFTVSFRDSWGQDVCSTFEASGFLWSQRQLEGQKPLNIVKNARWLLQKHKRLFSSGQRRVKTV